MKPEWLDFLIDAGAEIENNKVISFGNPQRERHFIHTGLAICDLSHMGLISADGEEAADFLQGQLTNDIHKVDLQHSQLSAYCTHKGRMLANFRIFKRNESFYLRLPHALLEPTLKRLSMFVLMAKVSLKDSSNALVGIGFSGPNADKELAQHFSELPTEVDDAVQADGYTIIKVAGTVPRYEIYGDLDAMKTLWQQLDVDASAVGSDAWESLDILAGIPTIMPETSEAFVPQMTNMQLINGVNFKKGCYTGQEVVARMQYLGKLKRRMFQVHIDSDEVVRPGDKLFREGSSSGQGTGQIVNAQINPDGGYNALAVIDISDAESGELTLHDANGPDVKLGSLPYNIEAAE